MSELVDADLPPEVRARLLDAIRNYLPAFLHRGASEQDDPAGDVRELLNLEDDDLRRVVSTHLSLDEDVSRFGERLAEGLRRPLVASVRPPEVGQSVRGSVDWSATVARRALAAGDPTLFVVRSARRAFDIPENRALVWLLERLRAATRLALPDLVGEPAASLEGDVSGWADRIQRLSHRIERARRVSWLQGIPAERPTAHTIKRLAASRSGFYAGSAAPALRATMRLRNPTGEVLADVLGRRYFEPAPTWLIFEVYVALRLARAFAAASGRPRKTRLLVGSRGSFARYAYDDGSEVALFYQGWPDRAGRSLRREAGDRQGLRPSPSRPDLCIVKTGPDPDVAVLELKASRRAGYLGEGLSQLLGYLGERPGFWRHKPAGWLVAPASEAFRDRAAEPREPLWIVSADRAPQAAVERFAP